MALPKNSRKRAPDEPPEGWETFVAWGSFPLEGPEPAWVQVGRLILPEVFTLGVRPANDAWRVWLQYGPVDDVVHLRQAWSAGEDLARCIEDLRRAWPLATWGRFAITDLVKQQLHHDEQSELVKTYQPGQDWHEREEWIYRRRIPLRTAALHEAAAVPIGGHRRNRVTDEHLREVADVYRKAFDAGANPTQAVQQHFSPGTSYSTAARWVGMARKRLPDLMPAPTRGVRKAQS